MSTKSRTKGAECRGTDLGGAYRIVPRRGRGSNRSDVRVWLVLVAALLVTSVTGYLATVQAEDPQFAVIRGRTISGSAVGRPVGGVEIRAYDMGRSEGAGSTWEETAYSEADGAFVFPRVPLWVTTAAISVESPSGFCLTRPVYVAPGANLLVVRLRSATELHGTVDMSEIPESYRGRPLRVWATWPCDSVADLGRATGAVDRDGTFQISPVPEGVSLGVALDIGDSERPGWPSNVVQVRAGEASPVIRALPGKVLSGQVGRHGSGRAGRCRVLLYSADTDGQALRTPLRSVETQVGAGFQFDGLPDVPYTLEVRAFRESAGGQHSGVGVWSPLGVLLAREAGLTPGGPSVTLVPSSVAMSSVVVFGAPNEEFVLSAWVSGANIWLTGNLMCNSAGVWRGEVGLPQALGDISLLAGTGRHERVGIAKVGPPTPSGREAVIRLRPGKTVTGRVIRADWESVHVQAEVGGWSTRSPLVREDGTFLVEGIPDGRCAVSVLAARGLDGGIDAPLSWRDYVRASEIRDVPAGASELHLSLRPGSR